MKVGDVVKLTEKGEAFGSSMRLGGPRKGDVGVVKEVISPEDRKYYPGPMALDCYIVEFFTYPGQGMFHLPQEIEPLT